MFTGSLSISGTIFGVLASLSLSLFSIFTKSVLEKLDQEIWLLSYYNNLYCSIILLLLMCINGEIMQVVHYDGLFDDYFWWIMTIGGLCGFSIGFLTSLQIKVFLLLIKNFYSFKCEKYARIMLILVHFECIFIFITTIRDLWEFCTNDLDLLQVTSPLTHNISGTAKACAQTVLATYWYAETKSFLWWLSNAIVLFGSASYARIKQLDMQQKHKENVSYVKV